MGTPLSRHALDARRSERVLLAAALAALLREAPAATTTTLAFSSATIASRRWPSLIPEIADSQPAKSSTFIESLSRPEPL